MNTEETTAGSLMGVSNETRKKFAALSLGFNLNKSENAHFLTVFSSKQLQKMGILASQPKNAANL